MALTHNCLTSITTFGCRNLINQVSKWSSNFFSCWYTIDDKLYKWSEWQIFDLPVPLHNGQREEKREKRERDRRESDERERERESDERERRNKKK